MTAKDEVEFAGFRWRRGLLSAVAARHLRERWETQWFDGSRVRLAVHRQKAEQGRAAYTVDVSGAISWGLDICSARSRNEALAMALIEVARRQPCLFPEDT